MKLFINTERGHNALVDGFILIKEKEDNAYIHIKERDDRDFNPELFTVKTRILKEHTAFKEMCDVVSIEEANELFNIYALLEG